MTRGRRAVGWCSIGDTLQEIFTRAEAHRVTPLAAALDLARSRLASGNGRV